MTKPTNQRVLVITTKKDIRYTIGVEDHVNVQDITTAVEECEGMFFQVIDTLSIRVDEILSVETYIQEIPTGEAEEKE